MAGKAGLLALLIDEVADLAVALRIPIDCSIGVETCSTVQLLCDHFIVCMAISCVFVYKQKCWFTFHFSILYLEPHTR